MNNLFIQYNKAEQVFQPAFINYNIHNKGGSYISYIRVYIPLKKYISKELNEAKHEFMNLGPSYYRCSSGTDLRQGSFKDT